MATGEEEGVEVGAVEVEGGGKGAIKLPTRQTQEKMRSRLVRKAS